MVGEDVLWVAFQVGGLVTLAFILVLGFVQLITHTCQ